MERRVVEHVWNDANRVQPHMMADFTGAAGCLAGVAALLVADLMPTLVGLAFVGSLAIVMVVMRMETLTPVQFFWLVTVLLAIPAATT